MQPNDNFLKGNRYTFKGDNSYQIRLAAFFSVMVWAGISYGYRIQLVVIDVNLNAQKYRPCPCPNVVPLLQNHGVISVF